MNIALIGLRSGSLRIKHKNIRDFAGKPLCYWIIKHAVESKLIDKVYILVDCQEYADIVFGFGFDKVEVLFEKTIVDGGNTNLAYQFIIDFPEIKFDNLCLLQAPCPLFKNIDEALGVFLASKKDSQLCIVKLNRFFWYNYGYPKNYKIHKRPKVQDLPEELVEVGACYITTKDNLCKSKNFLGGNIGLFGVGEHLYYEIETELDWIIIETINKVMGIL